MEYLNKLYDLVGQKIVFLSLKRFIGFVEI